MAIRLSHERIDSFCGKVNRKENQNETDLRSNQISHPRRFLL